MTGPQRDGLRRLALASAILLAALGMVSNLLFAAAFQFRIDWFLDPALAIAGGESSAVLLRWAAVTDLLSYYLPMVPIAIALRVVVREHDPVVADLATLAALGYVVVGSIGAGTLASAGPLLIRELAAGTIERAVLAADFRLLIEVVFRGLWQGVNGFLLALWFVGIGVLLRHDHRRFGSLAIVLGLVSSAGLIMNITDLSLLRDAAIGVLFVLWFIWTVWLAVSLHRRQLLG